MINFPNVLSSAIDWTLISVLVGAAALLTGVILIIRWYFHERSKIDLQHAFVTLRVRLPKDEPETGSAKPDWREQLAKYETFFINLGGVTWRPGGNTAGELWFNFWYGNRGWGY